MVIQPSSACYPQAAALSTVNSRSHQASGFSFLRSCTFITLLFRLRLLLNLHLLILYFHYLVNNIKTHHIQSMKSSLCDPISLPESLGSILWFNSSLSFVSPKHLIRSIVLDEVQLSSIGCPHRLS